MPKEIFMLSSNINPEIISEEDYPKKIKEIDDFFDKTMNYSELVVKDGMNISYSYLKKERADANIVIVHGFSEFSKKYSEMCWYFYNANYNVFIYDQRGHGLSGRETPDKSLCHVNSFEDYASDLEEFIDLVVAPQSDGKDIYIFSHSMGGMVTLLYLMGRNDTVKKAILSSPMIRPGTKGVPAPILKEIVREDGVRLGWDFRFRFASVFDPAQKWENVFDSSYSRFRHNLDMRISDVRYQNSSSTNRWMYEALTVHKKLYDKKSLANIKSDVLIIGAEHDGVVRASAQKKFSRITGIERVVMKNTGHSIYTSEKKVLEKYYGIIFDYFRR